MTEHASHPVAEHHEHHIVTPRVYLLIFGALMLGTALTVGASYIDMGEWNPVIALAIACTKAVLVILFWMLVIQSVIVLFIAAPPLVRTVFRLPRPGAAPRVRKARVAVEGAAK